MLANLNHLVAVWSRITGNGTRVAPENPIDDLEQLPELLHLDGVSGESQVY